MESKEFWDIYEEAGHRLFKWVMEHKDYDYVRDSHKEERSYWVAIVAQERTKKCID